MTLEDIENAIIIINVYKCSSVLKYSTVYVKCILKIIIFIWALYIVGDMICGTALLSLFVLVEPKYIFDLQIKSTMLI